MAICIFTPAKVELAVLGILTQKNHVWGDTNFGPSFSLFLFGIIGRRLQTLQDCSYSKGWARHFSSRLKWSLVHIFELLFDSLISGMSTSILLLDRSGTTVIMDPSFAVVVYFLPWIITIGLPLEPILSGNFLFSTDDIKVSPLEPFWLMVTWVFGLFEFWWRSMAIWWFMEQ